MSSLPGREIQHSAYRVLVGISGQGTVRGGLFVSCSLLMVEQGDAIHSVPAEGNWLVLNWATPTLVNEATVVINSDKTSKDYPCCVFQLPRQAIRAVLTSWLLGAPSEWVWYPPGATVEKFFRHRSWVLPDQSGAAQQGPLPTMIRSAMATAKVAEVLAVLKTNPCHPTDVADYACFPHNSGHQLRTLLMHYFFKNALQLQGSHPCSNPNPRNIYPHRIFFVTACLTHDLPLACPFLLLYISCHTSQPPSLFLKRKALQLAILAPWTPPPM